VFLPPTRFNCCSPQTNVPLSKAGKTIWPESPLPCRVRALSFYLRIPIGQTDLFQGTEQVKAIVEGSLDQRRIPNNLDTEDSNAALHPFFELKATHILSANLFFTSNCFKTRR